MTGLGKQRRGRLRAAVAAALALGALGTLAACSDGSGPTWRGSFTRAITSCGGSLVSVAIDPPIPATIESAGDFEVGRSVTLYNDGDCAFLGVIAEDGSLRAEMHAGCPAAAQARSAITIANVFAGRTEIRQTTDYVDPQQCDVEVWGAFDRD